MTVGNRKLIILISSCLVLAAVLAAGLVKKGSGTTKKTLQSSLLNTKYVERITSISLSVPDESQTGSMKQVVLSKESRSGRSVWLVSGSSFSSTVLADSTKVNRFIEQLSATSSFTVASESYKDWNAFGVTDGVGVMVSVKGTDAGGNEIVFSSLCFGYVTATETHIAVRNDRKETVYQVHDQFSGYFETDSSFWATADLFPELSLLSDGTLSEVRFTRNDLTRIWYAGEDKFEELVKLCGSVSGGQFIAALPADGEPVLSVLLLGGSNLTWKVTLFKTNEGQYIAQCLSPWDSKIVTVSSWTAFRLLD